MNSLFTLPLTAALSLTPTWAKQESRPNFIVIFCDDLGYGDLGCFGNPTIKTPHLDRMAQEGQKWSSFVVSASVSSPSRGGLLTGRYGPRSGLYGAKSRVLHPYSKGGMPQSEITLAEHLKAHGYATACVGKWHLGHQAKHMPLQHGFDVFYGIPYSNDMSKIFHSNYAYDLPFYDQEKVIELNPDQTDLTQKLTRKALSFIQENKNKPFFLYLTHPMPHYPVFASKDFQGKSDRGLYGDCIEELDWSVNEIIKSLKKNGLDKNTLVIFTSDNGPWLTYKELGGSSGPLKEGKASICEGGFRVPCIIWGGMVKPAHVTGMGSTLDLFPTFCEMAKIALPQDRVYDGVSLAKTIGQGTASARDTFYYYRGEELYALRKGDFKIFFAYKPGYGNTPKKVFKHPELYNLAKDPEEKHNVAAKHPQIVKELVELAKEHRASFRHAEALFDKTK